MKKTRAFGAKVLECRRVWLTPNNVYELIFGLLLAPISLAYLVVGRFFLAKLFFANNRCDGCGLCAKGCPVRAINMWGHEQPRPFWSHRCESCMRCAAFCPHNAIEAGHSWGVALYFLSTAPVAYYLFLWLGALAPALRGLNETWVGTTANLLYWYPAIFLPYYGLHLLLRIPAVNWLFTHTTLTHYWGRYREPEVRLGQLMGTKVDRANAIHRPQEPEGRVQAKPKTDCSMWLTDDGRQETYTPAEFQKQYGWKNDPSKAILLGSAGHVGKRDAGARPRRPVNPRGGVWSPFGGPPATSVIAGKTGSRWGRAVRAKVLLQRGNHLGIQPLDGPAPPSLCGQDSGPLKLLHKVPGDSPYRSQFSDGKAPRRCPVPAHYGQKSARGLLPSLL
jgi:Pyruvate/2-oxoacid:ferredoxin oxidoreductase delta subunit